MFETKIKIVKNRRSDNKVVKNRDFFSIIKTVSNILNNYATNILADQEFWAGCYLFTVSN